jgi:hypothetical protein
MATAKGSRDADDRNRRAAQTTPQRQPPAASISRTAGCTQGEVTEVDVVGADRQETASSQVPDDPRRI